MRWGHTSGCCVLRLASRRLRGRLGIPGSGSAARSDNPARRAGRISWAARTSVSRSRRRSWTPRTCPIRKLVPPESPPASVVRGNTHLLTEHRAVRGPCRSGRKCSHEPDGLRGRLSGLRLRDLATLPRACNGQALGAQLAVHSGVPAIFTRASFAMPFRVPRSRSGSRGHFCRPDAFRWAAPTAREADVRP